MIFPHDYLWIGSSKQLRKWHYPGTDGKLLLYGYLEVAALHALADPNDFSFTHDDDGESFGHGQAWLKKAVIDSGYIYAINPENLAFRVADAKRMIFEYGLPLPVEKEFRVEKELVLEWWQTYVVLPRY